jgi:hypothetical protein
VPLEVVAVLYDRILQLQVWNLIDGSYSAFNFSFFEIAILPSVAFGIPIANGRVHAMINLNMKVPRQS